MTYTFGDYELDTMLYELRYAGEPCKLEPRVFNVLAYLIAHRTQVVTRDELLDALWPGLFNSVSLLNTCIMEVRKAVGDSGQVQQVIKTFRSRGYRFIAPTTEQRKEDLAPETSEGCDVPLSTAPPAQEDVLGVSPAPGGSWEAFQDVLAGDQTVGTIVCGSWDEGELGTGGEGEEPRQRLQRFSRALGRRCSGMQAASVFLALSWDSDALHAGGTRQARRPCGSRTPTPYARRGPRA